MGLFEPDSRSCNESNKIIKFNLLQFIIVIPAYAGMTILLYNNPRI